jgi:Transposase DDE domain
LYGDAALYEPPPPRTRLTVAWYGGTTRAIEIVTGTGHGYRIGEALVEVRWVYVHDGTGTHRDEYCFTTDSTMKPQQMGECYTQRWSIETTVQECREDLQLESTQGYGQQTVLRFTPGLFGLYSMVVLLSLQLPSSSSPLRAIFWRGKSTVTCSDMLTCVRRALWEQWCFHTQADPWEFSTLSPSFRDTILSALAPAAYRAGEVRSQAPISLQWTL